MAATGSGELTVKVLALGCTLSDMRPPGGDNIVLAFRDPADYSSTNNRECPLAISNCRASVVVPCDSVFLTS